MQKFQGRGGLVAVLLLVSIFAGGALAAEERKYQRSVETLSMPDVVLINQDGERVRFKSLVESKEPVVVDFIYGTCTTICPVLSAGYANLQKKLGKDSTKVRLVSITIDPENDNPKVLKEYLTRYKAKPGWEFLTGSRNDINKVMYAFNAYFPNKMSHKPLNFVKPPGSREWIRLYGLMSSRDFLSECQKAGVQ